MPKWLARTAAIAASGSGQLDPRDVAAEGVEQELARRAGHVDDRLTLSGS